MKRQFDGLRFFAFLMVFGVHSHSFKWVDVNYFVSGGWAVMFFFCLSGFMIGFGDRGAPFSWRGTLTYLWRKVVRFYPLLFIAIVASTKFWRGIRCLLGGGDPRPEIWECYPIRHLLLVHAWSPNGVFEFNAVCWFLSTLMFLYLVSRLVLPVLRRMRTRGLLLVGAVMLGLLLGWCLTADGCGLERRYWTVMFPPAKVPEFILAVALGLVCARHADRLSRAFAGFGRCAAIEAVLVVVAVLMCQCVPDTTPFVFAWVAFNAVFFVFFTFSEGPLARFTGSRALCWLGGVSMPMFLLHCGVLNFVVGRLTARGLMPETGASRFGWWLACLLLSLAAALAYQFAEKAVRAWMGRRRHV